MDRETEILQDRIEVAALKRRLQSAHEWIRCDENEEVEGRRDPGLHPEHVRAQRGRQIAAENRNQSPE